MGILTLVTTYILAIQAKLKEIQMKCMITFPFLDKTPILLVLCHFSTDLHDIGIKIDAGLVFYPEMER